MHISEKIDHFVVLMYENRSFNNLLGKLPHPGDGPRKLDGIPDGWKLPRGPFEQHTIPELGLRSRLPGLRSPAGGGR